jgi:seryl-tRNA(Sec) selenium transferase
MLSESQLPYGANDRRSFLKLLVAVPLFASIGSRKLLANTVATATRRSSTEDGYRRFGVQTLINARGTWTYLSGSLELLEVRKALADASHHFVDIFELQLAVGKYLAKLSGAESGMVTSGSAGAIAVATAGCMAGTDPKNVWQLPDTTGMKGEVVMLGGRSAFDSAIRLCGAKLVVAPTVDDLKTALTSQTAMVYMGWDGDRLIAALKITKAAGVPLFLDEADDIPPFSNFSRFAKMGVDLYCFSGGKGLCGPYASGLLLGRQDLITAALANTNPWEGAVCRPMKVGKEEIMGIIPAVDYWSKADLNVLNAEWTARVKRIAKLVNTVSGVKTDIAISEGGNAYPTLRIEWDEAKFGLTVPQCAEQLRTGQHRIETLTGSNPSAVPRNTNRTANYTQPQRHRPSRMRIISMSLQPEEDLIVGNRLRQILEAARKQAA